MADRIFPHERALIDAAIAAGKVRRIRAGAVAVADRDADADADWKGINAILHRRYLRDRAFLKLRAREAAAGLRRWGDE
jgi:hypothetical protein